MKILFTTESYYPIIDGGAIAQHRIVHELAKKGHDVRVVAPGFNFKNTSEDDKGSIIYRPRGLKLPFYMNNKYHFTPFPFFYVKKIINKFKPDVINVNSPYPNSIAALICAKKYKIPVVGSIHILPENILAPFLKYSFYNIIRKYTWKYLIYFYNKVNWAIVPTQSGAEMYKARGLKTQVTPISNGVNTEMFKPENDGEYLRKKIGLSKGNIVLYTGRINQEKNIDVLIKAIPNVLKEIDAHFLICGSGGLKQDMIKLSEDLKISDNITFIEFLDWADYPNIYSLADLFVMPSEAELQSIVTMEAISSGLPVVAVNKGAVPELVSMGNGLLFESRKSDQMADHIVKILADKKLRKEMSTKSIKLAKEHSIKNVGSRYEEIYEKLIS